jgi:predicted RNA-binding Zn-ribbon protein involved in translation (DUF1610 family)
MAMLDMPDWTCSACGVPVEANEPQNVARRPCPNCGSTLRTAHASVTIAASVQVYMKVHSKHRDGGRKVVREEITGDDFHRKTGRWSIMRRLIDRANNWYEEVFHDRDTGNVIHKKAERLSDHRTGGKLKGS